MSSAHITIWFQFARGRAMVRNRSMRMARVAKARGNEPYTVEYAVKRARQAHRDWRRYRKLHLEAIADRPMSAYPWEEK